MRYFALVDEDSTNRLGAVAIRSINIRRLRYVVLYERSLPSKSHQGIAARSVSSSSRRRLALSLVQKTLRPVLT